MVDIERAEEEVQRTYKPLGGGDIGCPKEISEVSNRQGNRSLTDKTSVLSYVGSREAPSPGKYSI